VTFIYPPTHLYTSACRSQRSRSTWLYKAVAPAFFLAAQRAFIKADNFFFIAGLIGRRTVAFLAGAVTFFGVGLRFRCAHLSFIAAEMRFRAAGLIVRLRGRPRRGRDPSRAAIA
jgi:hypothetical protein